MREFLKLILILIIFSTVAFTALSFIADAFRHSPAVSDKDISCGFEAGYYECY